VAKISGKTYTPEEMRRRLDAAVQKAARVAVLATANRIVGFIVTDLIPSAKPPPEDRGIYKAAWRAEPITNGAAVMNTAPHAPMIEWGVRAANVKIGKKMIDALAGWVRRKGVVSGKGASAEAQARGVAFAIATKMKQRGIWAPKGLRILEKGMRRLNEFLQEEYPRELRRALK
jgi:hypothetical protein